MPLKTCGSVFVLPLRGCGARLISGVRSICENGNSFPSQRSCKWNECGIRRHCGEDERICFQSDTKIECGVVHGSSEYPRIW